VAVAEMQNVDALQTAVGSEVGEVRGSSIPARKRAEMFAVDSFT